MRVLIFVFLAQLGLSDCIWKESTKGRDLKGGQWTSTDGTSFAQCKINAEKAGVSYFAWTSQLYNGFCKVLKPTVTNPNLNTYQGYGYKLYEGECSDCTWKESTKGRDLKRGQWTATDGTSFLQCKINAEKAGVSYFAWTSQLYNGFCKVLKPTVTNPNLNTYQGYGYKLYEGKCPGCYEKQANTGCAYTIGSVSIDNGKAYSVSNEASCKKTCDTSSECVAFQYIHWGQHSGGPVKQGTGACYYYGGTVLGTSEEPNRSCFVKKDCAESEQALANPLTKAISSKRLAESSLLQTTNIILPDIVTYGFAAIGFLSVLYVGAKYGSKAFSQGDYAEVGKA